MATLLGLLFVSPGVAAAQNVGTVTGRITSAATMGPLSGVQVYLGDTGLGTLTTQEGRFIIVNVPAGTYTVRVALIGHTAPEQQIQVLAGQTVEASFSMQIEALGLDELVSRARLEPHGDGRWATASRS